MSEVDVGGSPVRRRRLRYAVLISGAVLVIALGALDAFLRSFDEASEEDRAHGIRTKIGTYASARPIGTFPLFLIWSLRQWPDRAACLSDPARQILRWADLGSRTSIEVCLSRVIANVGSDQEVAAILTANGFNGVSIRPASPRTKWVGSTVSGTCMATAQPCGVAVDEMFSFPGASYAFDARVSRFSHGMTDVRITQISK
jgi:hypothetical protein